jgi:hypothetical protein
VRPLALIVYHRAMRLGVLAVIALAPACGGGPPAKTAADHKPATPVCIEQPDEAAPITHANGRKNQVEFCVGTAVDQCFSLELVSEKLTRLSGQPKGQTPAIQAPAHLEITNPELKVCGTTGCKTLTPLVWPGAAPLHAATNGAVVAVMLGEAEAGRGYIEVHDVMKAKKLTSFRYARGEFRCGEIGMLGDTIYVGTSMCTSPSGRATLYSTQGTKIANVGGTPDFGMYGNAYTQVEDNVWAFLEENGSQIALQDVGKGKIVKTLDVGELFANGSATMGNPGESAIVRLDGSRLAVIAGAPTHGSVAIIDVPSATTRIVRAPLCP